MTSGNTNEVSAAADRARDCLHEAKERLRSGDLLQAATSGWKAADHMAGAVALVQGWPYDTPGKFLEVMLTAADQTECDRINVLIGPAHMLRDTSESQSELDYEIIKERVERVAEPFGAAYSKINRPLR